MDKDTFEGLDYTSLDFRIMISVLHIVNNKFSIFDSKYNYNEDIICKFLFNKSQKEDIKSLLCDLVISRDPNNLIIAYEIVKNFLNDLD